MGKITSLEKPQSNISEAYRTIRTGIEFSNLDKNLKVICVTSSKKDEGKTTVLCNLLGRKNIEECIKKTTQENLYVLTGGTIPPNPAEVLSSKKMSQFIESIKDDYDYIFIDTPPVGIVSDASIISSYSDGVIFVVGSEEVDSNLAKVAKERLDSVNSNILGVILNKYKTETNSEYYNYYYHSQEEKKKKRKRK